MIPKPSMFRKMSPMSDSAAMFGGGAASRGAGSVISRSYAPHGAAASSPGGSRLLLFQLGLEGRVGAFEECPAARRIDERVRALADALALVVHAEEAAVAGQED